MSYQIKQSSTAYPLVFLLVDSTDHVTAKTGLSPTVTLSKAGGSFASPSGAVTEIANGWYKVAGNATDTGTLGPLVLHATGTGADPVDILYEVVAHDPQDAVRLGLSSLPNAAAEAAGGLPTAGTGTNQINLAGGRADSNLTYIAGSALNTSTAQIGANVVNFGGSAGTFASGRPEVNTTHAAGTAWASGAITRDSLAADTGLQPIRSGTAQSGNFTSITLDASASATSDLYKGLWVATTGGTGAGQARLITSYNGTTKAASIVPNWTTQPDSSTTFALLPAAGVDVYRWLNTAVTANIAGVPNVDVIRISGDSVAADNLESYCDGTTPIPANATQISGDATAADNAEAFFDGTGYAGTNNVIPTVTTTTNVTTVNGLAAGVITATSIAADAITDAKVASDVTIASVTGAVGSVTGNVGGNVVGSVASVTAGVTLSSAAVQAIWDALTSALTTVGSIGKKLADWTIGTAQTGDAYARLGAPAGASVSADIAAVKAETALIVADTGTDGVVVAAGSKTGYSLASTGLDLVTAWTVAITGNIAGHLAGSVRGIVAGDVTYASELPFSGPGAWAYRQDGGDIAWDVVDSSTISAVASQTQFTAPSSAATADDFYNGYSIAIKDTSGNVAVEEITDYNGTTKVFTIAAAPALTIDTDCTVQILLPRASGGTGLDAAGVRAAIGLASANLDTQLADIPTVAEFEARTIVSANYATPTNITGGTIATVTNLTNLPSIPTDWITSAGIAASALDGKGNWNVGKTGYSLSSTGLDSIAATEPSVVPTTFREKLMALYMRFFNRTTRDSDEIKVYNTAGNTVVFVQTYTASESAEDVGGAGVP